MEHLFIDKFRKSTWNFTKLCTDLLELHKPQEITLPNGEWGLGCVECNNFVYPCKTLEILGERI